jgi:hypothetical protein
MRVTADTVCSLSHGQLRGMVWCRITGMLVIMAIMDHESSIVLPVRTCIQISWKLLLTQAKLCQLWEYCNRLQAPQNFSFDRIIQTRSIHRPRSLTLCRGRGLLFCSSTMWSVARWRCLPTTRRYRQAFTRSRLTQRICLVVCISTGYGREISLRQGRWHTSNSRENGPMVVPPQRHLYSCLGVWGNLRTSP